MGERKRGALSTRDMKYIKDNIDLFSIEEIAKALNRNLAPIERYVQTNKLSKEFALDPASSKHKKDLVRELKEKPFYKSLLEQFTPKEIAFFTEHWLLLTAQFHNDVLPSEEMELRELLTLEIFKNREASSQKSRRMLIQQMRREMNKLKDIPGSEKTPIDRETIRNLQTEIIGLETAITSQSKSYRELCEKTTKIRDALHASRKDRAKDLTNAKMDFTSWLKLLDDFESKNRIAREMEIIRLAQKKERQKLAEYHTFANDDVSKPLLNAETVSDDE